MFAIMDTSNLDSTVTPGRETDPEHLRRFAREIAEAGADTAAGRLVDGADVDAWIDSIGTEREVPQIQQRDPAG
jgi:hypothetical protein